MNQLSVVIITLNEENNIAGCIRSVQSFSDDIIVIDAQSEDNTGDIAMSEGARVFSVEWRGYGHSRNFGALQAKHDWILALDADERVSPELIDSIQSLSLSLSHIYRFSRKNHIANKPVRFGTMGADKVTRIYNRNFCRWDLSSVHEKLQPNEAITKRIGGHVNHYPFKSLDDYRNKMTRYAELSAEKYFAKGKRAGFFKLYLSPYFNALKSYIFQLGFLEGKRGLAIARTIAYYTRLKYFFLSQLQESSDKEPHVSVRRFLKTAASD